MHVLVTGATGFIGRALTLRLEAEGHAVSAWVRNPAAARASLGEGPRLLDASRSASLNEVMGEIDGVINLAGEPVALTRWTDARRERLVASRVDVTRALVSTMAACVKRPRVLVSASAVGYYGDRGDDIVDESSPAGSGFLADLCNAWEKAAREASPLGVRVTSPRIGIVLGPGGGALAPMLPAFKAGLGGPIAGGKQWMSWIHLDDMVNLLLTLLTDDRYDGPVNATAPNPVTNTEFARTLGAALHRPSLIPLPGFALKLALGESAEVVTGGQRVRGRRTEELGFRFVHETLAGALEDIVRRSR